MKKGRDKAGFLTQWGNSLLNKLSSQARNNRKRDASKRRRKSAEKEIDQSVEEMLPENICPWVEGRTDGADRTLTLADLETRKDLLSDSVKPVWDTISGRSDVEMADQITELLGRLVQEPNKEDSIRLYQLFFTDYYTHFGTWGLLDSKWNELGFASSEFLYDFFLYWVEKAPDHGAIDAALFFLGRTNNKPPMELLFKLSSNHFLAVGSAAVIAKQYDADEDALINLATMHGFATRMGILSFLVDVKHPENKEWLLTEGYDSGAEYHPCGYYAAVHGDLISLLRLEEVDREMLQHYGRILADMCQAAGGSSAWKTIYDYGDALEAIERLFHHVNVVNKAKITSQSTSSVTVTNLSIQHVTKSMSSQLRDILRFLDYEQTDEEDALWDIEQIKRIYQLGRELFTVPHFTEEEIANLLYWEQPPSTIEDLEEKGITVFYDVLEIAKESDNDKELQDVISWAIDYLDLYGDKDEREEIKKELLAERMPGVCSGGIAGLQDPGLGSIYGQVLLQIAQALEGRSPMGEPLLIAALETDYPHLPKIAADTLRQWPQENLPVGVQEALRKSSGDALGTS